MYNMIVSMPSMDELGTPQNETGKN
jgi:hypothetical protein